MRYSKETWAEIKRDYEDMDSNIKIKDIVAKYGPTKESIARHAKLEGWVNPRKLTIEAKRLALKRQRDEKNALIESLADRYEESRETAFECARKALEDFADKNPVPKDFHEAVKAFELSKSAAGIKDDAPAVALNIGLLSSAPVDVVDV